MKEQDYLTLLFNMEISYRLYIKKLNNNDKLYFRDVKIPKEIIRTYFENKDKLQINYPGREIFKKLLVTNEYFAEGRNPDEKKGFGVMYDYIDIYHYKNAKYYLELILVLHNKLYSKCKSPEAGGKYRISNSLVTRANNIASTDWALVPEEMNKLRPLFDEIVEISNTENFDVFEYIDKIVKLKCKIIKIHPFDDGNGRSTRGLVNLFFKKVDLPLVFLDFDERDNYYDALQRAMNEDYNYITNFYYYKICSSIMELGLKPKKINEQIIFEDDGEYIREWKPRKESSQMESEEGIERNR